jgi:hypothetical protein
LIQKVAPKHNKLPKFAAKSAAGTNTHWAKPNNVRICPLAKRYKSQGGLEWIQAL